MGIKITLEKQEFEAGKELQINFHPNRILLKTGEENQRAVREEGEIHNKNQ